MAKQRPLDEINLKGCDGLVDVIQRQDLDLPLHPCRCRSFILTDRLITGSHLTLQAVIKIHVEIIAYFIMISFILKDSLNMRYFVKDSLNRERKLGLYVTGIN